MKIKRTKTILGLAFTLLTTFAFSQSSLNCDFSNENNKKNKIFNFWDIENKIFSGPITTAAKSQVDNGGRARNLNFVRTLGGWRKNVNGIATKDRSGDLATFQNGAYVYDASKMINKLKQYIRNGVQINQIVLDNPPWVFQRGLKFVEQRNNVDYLKSTEIETYGNAIPPNSNREWRRFIRVVMNSLVDEFGLETVENWRFRGGSEIETSGHWAGTSRQYFRHYKIISEEVKRAVPNAKVGVHLREASFMTNKLNYKGQRIQSFGKEFITWTKENNVQYDFIGVSYYPFYNRLEGGLGGLDVFKYYDEGIKPLTSSPDFNKDASVEIHEFWLFTNFGRGLLVNVGTSHGSAFFVKLARLAYERGIKKINQWGYGKIGRLLSPQRMTMKMLKAVLGHDRYRYTSTINTQNNNTIDAIFTSTKIGNSRRFNAIVSNYSDIPEYSDQKERIVVNMQIPYNIGQEYEYRIISYGRDECGFNQLKNKNSNYSLTEAQGGWLRNGVDGEYGHISRAMGGSGKTRRARLNTLVADANTLQRYNIFKSSEWISGVTKRINSNGARSRLTVVLNLESFMVNRIEVRLRDSNRPVVVDDIVEEDERSNISIMPNPASGSFNISLQGINNATVEISNLEGRLIYRERMAESSIRVTNNNRFQQGMYIVRVIANNGSIYNGRLIVN